MQFQIFVHATGIYFAERKREKGIRKNKMKCDKMGQMTEWGQTMF